MLNLLLVAGGGASGAVARYLVGMGWVRGFGPARPYLATALINVLGSTLMGLLIGWLAQRAAAGTGGAGWSNERTRLLLAVGVLGGFTTFSSFSLEAVMLFERRAYAEGAAYVIGSVTLGLVGLLVGLTVARRVFA